MCGVRGSAVLPAYELDYRWTVLGCDRFHDSIRGDLFCELRDSYIQFGRDSFLYNRYIFYWLCLFLETGALIMETADMWEKKTCLPINRPPIRRVRKVKSVPKVKSSDFDAWVNTTTAVPIPTMTFGTPSFTMLPPAAPATRSRRH